MSKVSSAFRRPTHSALRFGIVLFALLTTMSECLSYVGVGRWDGSLHTGGDTPLEVCIATLGSKFTFMVPVGSTNADWSCHCSSNPGATCSNAFGACPVGYWGIRTQGGAPSSFGCHDAPGHPGELCDITTAALGCGLPPGAVIPSENRGACDEAPCLLGNPIHPKTGNKFQQETDYHGTGPLPLEFVRYYNSDPSLLGGKKWSMSYSRRVIYVGKYSDPRDTLLVRDNGAGHWFRLQSDSSWRPDVKSVKGNLTKLVDGSGNHTGWMYVNPNDETETYDGDGKLLAITSALGFTITTSYTVPVNDGGDGKSETLDKITDHFSRSIQIRRASSGRISKLVLPTGAEVEYAGDYPAGAQHFGVLTKVTFPDADTNPSNNTHKDYFYDESAHVATGAPTGLLTGLSDENSSRYATWKYDALGRAYDSSHAGGAEHVALTYNTDGTTTFTDSVPTSQTLSFSVTDGFVRATGLGGSQNCALCKGRPKLAAHENGYLSSKTDLEGNKTLYTHNERGLETCRLEGIPADSNSDPAAKAYRVSVSSWFPNYRIPQYHTVWEPINSVQMAVPTSCPGTPDTAIWRKRRVIEQELVAGTSNILKRTERSFFGETKDEEDRIWTFAYYDASGSDAALSGLLKQIDGPRPGASDITDLHYITSTEAGVHPHVGDLWKVIRKINSEFSIETEITKHDADGQPLSIRDNNGTLNREFTYDLRGWLLSRKIAEMTTQFKYDAAGQLVRVTLPDGSFARYQYDAAHRLTDIWDGYIDGATAIDVNHIHYTLDAIGNRTHENICASASCASSNSTFAVEQDFDSAATLHALKAVRTLTPSITYASITNYRYDLNGNVQKIIDPRDPNPSTPTIYTEYKYDALNRPIKVTDAMGKVTLHRYDVFDQETLVDPADVGATSLTYNGFGELKVQQSPDTNTTSFGYDEAGKLVSLDDARPLGATIYAYDGINRLTGINYPTSPDITFEYDDDTAGHHGIGRLTSVADESGTTRYRYDARGNLTRATVELNNGVQGQYYVQYDYDNADRLVTITYPSSRTVTFVRDAVGRVALVHTSHLSEVDDVATGVTYAPFGPVIGFNFGATSSGQTFSRPLDLSYRVTSIVDQALSSTPRQYFYDEVIAGVTVNTENITRITETAANQTLTYDVMDRLTSATGPYGTHLYSSDPYDGVGNRKGTNIAGNVQAYTYELGSGSIGTSRLSTVSSGGPAFQYDSAGNARKRNALTFAYGDDLRSKTVSNTGLLGAAEVTYKHNYLGQRVTKHAGAQTIYYVYGPNGELLAELDNAGSSQREYVYLDGMPIAMFTPPSPTDTDGDGMPDSWETLHGLNPNSAADASLDTDGDDLTALQEYQADTNPMSTDTDSDGTTDGVDSQPTVDTPAWMIPIQNLLQ